MCRAEELFVICAIEGFAKRYPFFVVYSVTIFARLRNFRGPETKSWITSDATRAKRAMAIYMVLADLNKGRIKLGSDNLCYLLLSIATLSLFFTVTSATTFSPLSVRTSLPSVVCIMLRTTPPPAGITQVWNFSVLGSKRTSVFGRTPDSLYQTMPSMMVIAYGLDLGPPGEGHSAVILPVLVSKRPR